MNTVRTSLPVLAAALLLVLAAPTVGCPPPAKEASPWFQPKVNKNPEISVIDREGPGTLLRVERLLVCVMAGTPAEMGFQHGRLLASRIRGLVHERYMARTLYGRGYTREYVNSQAATMEKHFPDRYIEEMRGLVAGLRAAGVNDVTYEDLRAGVCMAELQHHAPGDPPGCTNFALFGRWTPDGRLYHGRNLDWNINGSAQDDAVLLVWRPGGGVPFMMLGWAGCIGSVTGMNALGITIGEMTSTTPDETFDGLPLFLFMRQILEEAANLDQAAALMHRTPRTLGWNFVMGDGKVPAARAFEVDAAACEVFAPMDPAENRRTGHSPLPDLVRRTNHPCGDRHLKKAAAMHAKAAGQEMPEWDAALPLVSAYLRETDSWQRYDWLGRQIGSLPGKVDRKEALRLLTNGPVRCNATLHSVLFDPRGKTVYVSNAGVDPVCSAWKLPYLRIDLASWFDGAEPINRK